MKSLSLDSLFEWNPQFFREIKGRFKPRNIAIAIGISLVIQLLTWMSLTDQPGSYKPTLSSPYCSLDATAMQYKQEVSNLEQKLYYNPVTLPPEETDRLQKHLSDVQAKLNEFCPKSGVDMQLWRKIYWSRFFIRFSFVSYFILIVAGTYLLIQDLAAEEKRGTLNFIRLSPQPYHSIFLGKLLGVPSLLYLGIALALPLHLYAGLTVQIPGIEIFSFYTLIAASCFLTFSTALLFGLVTTGLNGFQAWLGASVIWFFQYVINQKDILRDGSDWLNMFSPLCLLRYLINRAGSEYPTYINTAYTSYNYEIEHGFIKHLEWFDFSIGQFGLTLVLFALVNYGIWTLGVWQGLKRSFRDQNATILSKRHSYYLTACFTLLNLGFTWQNFKAGEGYEYALAFCYSLIWFLVLMVALLPRRQALQDWARYRRERTLSPWHDLLQDLIWGEKSPGIIAFAINLLIFSALFSAVILAKAKPDDQSQMFLGLLFHISFIFILATVAQLMLFLKLPKQGLWATGVVSAVMFLPLLIAGFLNWQPSELPNIFLISFMSFSAIHEATLTGIAVTLFGEFVVMLMLNVQLTRLLKTAGESTTKKLLQNP